MASNANMFRPAYDQLPETERHALLHSIAESNPPFTLKSIMTFNVYDMVIETAVYDHNGTEFVFVPGSAVTVGWDSFTESLSNVQLSHLGWDSIDRLTEFLRGCTSPVGEATVGPMLIERQPKEIGWTEVAEDSAEFRAVFRGELPAVTEDPPMAMMGFGRSRIIFGRGRRTCYLYKRISYDELLATCTAEGFRFPTEDEFEYLCGGGTRTLYRWGDMLLPPFARQFGVPKEDEPIDPPEGYSMTPFYLAGANFLGVSICFDPSRSELVQHSPVWGKGGDGGCAMCGGEGPFGAFLPYATFYWNRMEDLDRDDVSGNYTLARKIKRL
jgi:hypothetical protein